tara:strand:+ start:699 stop:1376 length:678 start_codon:yes stop_codon:yes gene_type:complete
LKKYDFDKDLEKLPSKIPVFPLNNALLLPKCRLPLNLFENRYLHMFDYAIKNHRIIGMVQPLSHKNELKEKEVPKVYSIGCAGLIVAFNQTNDNRYEIVLKGITRFTVLNEVKSQNGFRLFNVSWAEFHLDTKQNEQLPSEKRSLFEKKLKSYFQKIDINADWQAIEASNDEDLVNSISMGCPFSSLERQALLEAKNLDSRVDVLNSLLDMSINENNSLDQKSLS